VPAADDTLPGSCGPKLNVRGAVSALPGGCGAKLKVRVVVAAGADDALPDCGGVKLKDGAADC
jgi:hypothetical protein